MRRHAIVPSRVRDIEKLEQAVATYAARLGAKLKGGGLGNDHVTVFVHTSEHDRGSRSVRLR